MRTVPVNLAEHLAGGVTTLCHCWKVTRTDGNAYGFTDHDRSLSFDAVDYIEATGVSASETTTGPGLSVGGQEMSGAFALNGLDEKDLRAGRWDDAEINVYLVNWQNVSQRMLIAKGNIGETTSEDGAYRAEIRSLSHRLDQPRGRVFSSNCDADVGDERCGVNLNAASYFVSGTVVETDGRRQITVDGLDGFADNWFSRGHLNWTSGSNNSTGVEVKTHLRDGAVTLQLWQATGLEIEPGDTFKVTAGCDKQFEMCRTKFDNGIRFRGFPHVPGNDFALSYPTPDSDKSGTA